MLFLFCVWRNVPIIVHTTSVLGGQFRVSSPCQRISTYHFVIPGKVYWFSNQLYGLYWTFHQMLLVLLYIDISWFVKYWTPTEIIVWYDDCEFWRYPMDMLSDCQVWQVWSYNDGSSGQDSAEIIWWPLWTRFLILHSL